MRFIPQVQTLIDALDEPILLVDGSRILVANTAAKTLFGYGIEGGDLRLAIRQPEALQFILAGRSGQIETSGIVDIDRPWLVMVRTLGEGVLLVRLTDRSAARSAERMRVDFVANASHELRTPLTTIGGYAETLAEDGDLDPELRSRFARTILSESRRMLRIVEDLMSLSRIEADRFVTPAETVSVASVVELAGAHARELAGARECQIEIHVEDDLPSVRGDIGQLVQMTDNLVSNALRYGCTARSCAVRIRALADGESVVISVSDQGEGIAAEHIPRLTERFYRVDETRSRDSGGTGLGLAIVKHIVERHRGRLEVRSVVGSGTEVRIRLPAARSAATVTKA